jgi:hypothetical protein
MSATPIERSNRRTDTVTVRRGTATADATADSPTTALPTTSGQNRRRNEVFSPFPVIRDSFVVVPNAFSSLRTTYD